MNNFFKNIINRITGKYKILLDSPKNLYNDLIKNEKIQNIINNIPEGLSKLEVAYYVYIELGKFLKENPQFVFNDILGKKRHYNDKMDEEFYGICKSISELYVSILNQIGINAELVKETPDSSITHVDTILRIDGKNYIVNLIQDLSRIKTHRRTNGFGYDLARKMQNREAQKENRRYLKQLEKYYGKISYLDRDEINKLDKKIGYSIGSITTKDEESGKYIERGIYTEDTLELLRKEFPYPYDEVYDGNKDEYLENIELKFSSEFKEHILKGNTNIKKEEVLIYILDYCFSNIDRLTEFSEKQNMDFFAILRYYQKIAQKILPVPEQYRIQSYAYAQLNENEEVIQNQMIQSVIKVNPIHSRKKE